MNFQERFMRYYVYRYANGNLMSFAGSNLLTCEVMERVSKRLKARYIKSLSTLVKRILAVVAQFRQPVARGLCAGMG